MRYTIVFEYHRVPKQHVYDVALTVVGHLQENMTVTALELESKSQDLQVAAMQLHHVVRLVALTQCEFKVRCVQGDFGSTLAPNEVRAIQESEDSARAFFAPTIIERKANAHS